jgi:hypothetical protein
VGDQPHLSAFLADDSFLRRIGSKRLIRDEGEVAFEAFRPRPHELTLSFTFQDHTLRSEPGLDEYHRWNALNSGDLPGICKLTLDDLTAALDPPLLPRPDPDPDDDRYGHLHCVTDLPVDQAHMERMAKLATKNGVIRRFVRAKHK